MESIVADLFAYKQLLYLSKLVMLMKNIHFQNETHRYNEKIKIVYDLTNKMEIA